MPNVAEMATDAAVAVVDDVAVVVAAAVVVVNRTDRGDGRGR